MVKAVFICKIVFPVFSHLKGFSSYKLDPKKPLQIMNLSL